MSDYLCSFIGVQGPSECYVKDIERAKTNDHCGYLISESNPFKSCRESKMVNFDKMYSSCQFDVCFSDKDNAHCPTLENTALECSQHGYEVKRRSLIFCRKLFHFFSKYVQTLFFMESRMPINLIVSLVLYVIEAWDCESEENVRHEKVNQHLPKFNKNRSKNQHGVIKKHSKPNLHNNLSIFLWNH